MLTDAEVVTTVQTEHDSILNDTSWSRRKAESFITTVVPYETGTVSSNGDTLIGSGTTFTSIMSGRWVRVTDYPTTYIQLSAFNSTTSMTLETEFSPDLSASTDYIIFQHVYSLPEDCARVLNISGLTPVNETTRQQIDSVDPYRNVFGSDATHYAIRGLDTNDQFELELWPVPNAVRFYRLQYLKTNTLTSDSSMPLYRATILIWKAAESGCFFLHARTGDAAWLSLADRYHQRYLEDLQGAKEDDLGRMSVRSHVKDAYTEGELGTDFWIGHDPLRLL